MNLDLEKKLKTYRLTVDEFEKIKILLKREPQGVEWALFSALWSEHCSYKSSKNHLKKFSFRNAATPSMDGENAGVVDLGYGEKIAFKIFAMRFWYGSSRCHAKPIASLYLMMFLH